MKPINVAVSQLVLKNNQSHRKKISFCHHVCRRTSCSSSSSSFWWHQSSTSSTSSSSSPPLHLFIQTNYSNKHYYSTASSSGKHYYSTASSSNSGDAPALSKTRARQDRGPPKQRASAVIEGARSPEESLLSAAQKMTPGKILIPGQPTRTIDLSKLDDPNDSEIILKAPAAALSSSSAAKAKASKDRADKKLKMKVKFMVKKQEIDKSQIITQLRAMEVYLLDPVDLEDLPIVWRQRSAYHGKPSLKGYSVKDVMAKAVKKFGSERALQKRQLAAQRMANANKIKAKQALMDPYDKEYLQKQPTSVVLIAITANSIDAVAKLIGYMMTNSHSMFAECIHSCADTVNQIILFIGIQKASHRPDKIHPYGYANVRHVTSLISGVGIFFIGTGLNLYHGIEALAHQTPLQPLSWGVCLLGVSLITQGGTIYKAVSELSRRARMSHMSKLEFIRKNEDPSLNVVLLEDTASIGGVLVAGGCIGLSHYLQSPIPDALGSIVVAGILGMVASKIISSNASHLVGRSIPEDEKSSMVEHLVKDRSVRSVHDVKATELGSEAIRFKAEIEFDGRSITKDYLKSQDMDEMLQYVQSMEDSEEMKEFMIEQGEKIIDKMGEDVDRIEQNLKEKFPDVRHVDLESL